MGKRKKQQQAEPRPTSILVNEELSDELAASEGIFDTLFKLLDDGLGCSLRVVPSPGNALQNDAQFDLEVRFPPNYPRRPALIQVNNASNVEEHKLKALEEELAALARECAGKEEVALFHLYDHASNWLQSIDPAKFKVRSQRTSLSSSHWISAQSLACAWPALSMRIGGSS
jgi:hypothetical protein